MFETKTFSFEGRVEAVLLGSSDSGLSQPRGKIRLFVGHGVHGDEHAGRRLLDIREKEALASGLLKGMEIANHREVSIVSVEELAAIQESLQLAEPLPSGSLGENLIVSGIPRLSELPSGTLLFFRGRTAGIAVWRENIPCSKAATNLAGMLPEEHRERVAGEFVKIAMGKRGIVGSVYASGIIKPKDTILVHVPHQRIYDYSA